MIEVSNELTGSVDGCPNSSVENPPYKPAIDGDHLQTRTLCMPAENIMPYDLHSLYGYLEARSSLKYQAMTLATARPSQILKCNFHLQFACLY
jgi:lysosomal alpha-glucosidase